MLHFYGDVSKPKHSSGSQSLSEIDPFERRLRFPTPIPTPTPMKKRGELQGSHYIEVGSDGGTPSVALIQGCPVFLPRLMRFCSDVRFLVRIPKLAQGIWRYPIRLHESRPRSGGMNIAGSFKARINM